MPTPFRYVTPVPPETATGRTARVYAQLAGDFGMPRMPVFMSLSPAPDVLAATWVTLRESLLAGRADRTGKEVVALAVSMANSCPFCVDAHTVLLHATGDHRLAETIASGGTPEDPEHAALLAWGRATRTPGAAELADPPYPAELAPEYIGTALVFHFINRTASALLTGNLLPGNLQKSRVVRSVGGRAMARTVRRRLPEGAGLPLLDGLAAGPHPAWAAGHPVGPALAALRETAGAGGELLDEPARAFVRDTVAAWDGTNPPLGGRPDLAALPGSSRPAAGLALLAALAPYRITDADVSAWRAAAAGTDTDLVRLVAFGAITATEHAEAAITAATRDLGRLT
ncbi:carboxymuconolactone decarboxylase family protein [Nonomuraea sp. NPDC048916]|uniref:carboxymuconolactone decarboxylase family protein n=1 Tax=Nonomuraea sp. NPDC048916 TaxID=3154232 RepID=UPI0033E59625